VLRGRREALRCGGGRWVLAASFQLLAKGMTDARSARNDRQKGNGKCNGKNRSRSLRDENQKGKSKDKYRGPSLRSRMTRLVVELKDDEMVAERLRAIRELNEWVWVVGRIAGMPLMWPGGW
jgi:hypothetical protein